MPREKEKNRLGQVCRRRDWIWLQVDKREGKSFEKTSDAKSWRINIRGNLISRPFPWMGHRRIPQSIILSAISTFFLAFLFFSISQWYQLCWPRKTVCRPVYFLLPADLRTRIVLKSLIFCSISLSSLPLGNLLAGCVGTNLCECCVLADSEGARSWYTVYCGEIITI